MRQARRGITPRQVAVVGALVLASVVVATVVYDQGVGALWIMVGTMLRDLTLTG